MNLYQIDSALAGCVDAETGEILDVEKLMELNMAREQKIESAAESKKKYLDFVLNGEKFSTPRCSISYHKTTSVEVSDMGAVVAWMLANGHDGEVTYTAPAVSKTDLATLLKSGAEIDGATLVQGMSMGVK